MYLSSLYCSACPQMYLFITIPVQFISSFSAYPVQWPFNSSTGVAIYTHIHPKINLPVYLHASLPSNHKDLFMTLPVHFQTFILITVKMYPSTFLLFYMSTDVPVHHYTCSVYFFIFGIKSTVIFQLVYWGTYTHIHPKIHLPVYPHAFLWSNNKDLPVSITTSVPAHRCTRSWPYLFIFIQSFG